MQPSLKLIQKHLKKENRKQPATLHYVPPGQWPSPVDPNRIRVLRSRFFLVQVFRDGPGLRLSINRTTIKKSGRWDDNISWDELQVIKQQAGYRDVWAVEVFPPDEHIVNVANMRHLWIMPGPLGFGWRNE